MLILLVGKILLVNMTDFCPDLYLEHYVSIYLSLKATIGLSCTYLLPSLYVSMLNCMKIN